MQRKLNVLISAFACRPGSGSENEVGWHWAREAARDHNVWVITEERNRPEIEAALRAGGPQPQVVYHSVRFRGRDLRRWVPGLRPYYLLWQFTALKTARELHQVVGFDLAHHLTYASLRYPSFLERLGIPYVWGPVGGGERAPVSFYRDYPVGGLLATGLRDLSNLASRFEPFARRTSRRAAVRVATTPESAALMQRQASGMVIVEPNVRMEIGDEEDVEPRVRLPGSPLQLLFVGRLNHYKGVHLAIEAMAVARAHAAQSTLTVVGAGPEADRWRALAAKLGLGDAVDFRGRVHYEQMTDIYREHDALIFPSLHDSGGFAVIEAMAQQLPVICLGIGGPAVAVDDASGFVVDASNPDSAVEGMAQAICALFANPDCQRRMGRAARERVRHMYSAQRTRERLGEFYSMAVTAR